MMFALSLSLLAALCALSMVLILTLVVFLLRSQKSSQNVISALLAVQVEENQLLRNQLRAPDLQTLAGLNSLTTPSSEASQPEVVDLSDLGESIAYEETLHTQGYSLGDAGGFESAGWAPTVIRREGAEFTAFDPS